MVFLSTDIVNSSAICRQLGDSIYRDKLYTPHWTILNDCLSCHNGQFYENKGDGLLATFDSVKDAVSCAVEIQHRLNNPVIEYNNKRIAIRIGIHRAEVELVSDESGKYRTGELNFVCRIESIANGNQILLSNSTLQSLPGYKEYQWLEWQNRRIKSFDEEPVTVWELLWDGQSRGTPGASWAPDWFTGDVSEYVSRPDLETRISEAFGSKHATPYRLVTLHGSGGTGKTRLALTSAVKMAGLFEGKVHFITFHQKPGDVTDGGALLLQELRNTTGCEDAKLETVLIALSLRGNALFLIDNYETIAGESAQDVLVKILQRTKDIRMLVTGQKKVELPDTEHVIELQEGMTEEEGVALFIQRARNLLNDWKPTQSDLKEISRIVALVERIPLRIEFSAAWLRKRDLKTIVNELESSPFGKISALPAGSRLAATTREHHKSSELCMEYTCSLLSEPHRNQFYQLGPFVGSFTSEVASNACGIEDADELMDALVDSSLINRFGNLQEYRYSMHRLTARYCDRKLRERTDWKEIAVRFIHFYAGQAEETCTEEAIQSQANHEFIRNEWLNLKSAALLGIELNAVEDTLNLANHLMFYIRKEKVWSEGIELYGALLKWYETTDDPDPKQTARLCFELGWYHKQIGNYTQTIELFNRYLGIAETVWGSDSVELLDALHELADSNRDMTNFTESEKLFLRAISLKEKHFGLNNPAIANELVGLSRLYDLFGNFNESEPLLLRARAILEPLPDREAHKYHKVLNALCQHYNSTGRYAEAEPLCKQALAIAERVEGKESSGVLWILYNLGLLYHGLARYQEASSCSERALAIAEKIHGKEHPELPPILLNLARSYSFLERDEDVSALYHRCLAVCERVYGKNHKHTGTVFCDLGMYNLHRDKYDEALHYLDEALTIHRNLFGPEHYEIAIIMCNIGQAQMYQERYAEAETTLRQAWKIHEKAVGRVHPYTANMISSLGHVCLRVGKLPESEEYLRIALDIREQVMGKDHVHVASSHLDLAKALSAQRKKEEAVAHCQTALENIVRIFGEDHQNSIMVRSRLAEIQAAD